jgi:hypothetical protein
MHVLVSNDDSRSRLWRQLRDWDWSPLVACLKLQGLSQLGGRNAAYDAMRVLDVLCGSTEGSPPNDVAGLACSNLISAGGVQVRVAPG